MPEEEEPTTTPNPVASTDVPSGAEAQPAPPPVEEDWGTRFKYLLADFENFRKRSEKDREAAHERGRALLLRRLLPLYEAFDSARAAVSRLPAEDPVRRGFDLLGKEWNGFLAGEKVTPVVRVGERFRMDDMEAIGEGVAAPGQPEGIVLEVVQQGYRFSGGLLRPAKVVVSRRPPPPASAASTVAAAASRTSSEEAP